MDVIGCSRKLSDFHICCMLKLHDLHQMYSIAREIYDFVWCLVVESKDIINVANWSTLDPKWPRPLRLHSCEKMLWPVMCVKDDILDTQSSIEGEKDVTSSSFCNADSRTYCEPSACHKFVVWECSHICITHAWVWWLKYGVDFAPCTSKWWY